MASGSRQKTTMAKLTRERALRERRELKQAKKAARRLEAASPPEVSEPPATEPELEPGDDAPPRGV
jgi:hypothetical protein